MQGVMNIQMENIVAGKLIKEHACFIILAYMSIITLAGMSCTGDVLTNNEFFLQINTKAI